VFCDIEISTSFACLRFFIVAKSLISIESTEMLNAREAVFLGIFCFATASSWDSVTFTVCTVYGFAFLISIVTMFYLVMTRYFENSDISFSISIYHIILYRQKKYRLF